MKNNYIVQFEVCLCDNSNDNDSIKTVNEWVKSIQQFNHNTLWANNPFTNPVISNIKVMKSLN